MSHRPKGRAYAHAATGGERSSAYANKNIIINQIIYSEVKSASH